MPALERLELVLELMYLAGVDLMVILIVAWLIARDLSHEQGEDDERTNRNE